MSAETIRIEIPIETIDNTDDGVQSAVRNIRSLEQAAGSLGRAYDNAENRVSRYDQTQERTQKKLAQWAKEKYEILLEAKEKITPILSKIGGSMKNLTGKAWNITMKVADLATAPIKGVIDLLKNPLLQAGAVLGVGFGVADSINTYKDFEAAMSQVKAISGASGAEFDKLTEKAKQMGATTKFTAAESAEAMNYMAMAGWKTNDMLAGIGGIMNLAAASGEDLATTSDIVTDALTAFGLTAADSGHFADILATASSNANTNVAMMGETFKYVAPLAGTMGFSAEDAALGIGLMANSGIKASQAGTSLRGALTRLVKPTDEMESTMVNLGLAVAKTAHVIDSAKVDKLQGRMADKTATMAKAQISYNSAVAKYGESSAQAQKAAISLSTAQRKLAETSDGLAKAQAGSTKVIGIQNTLLTDGKGNINSFRDIILKLRETFKGLTQEQQAQSAATLFGQEAMSGMLAIINASEADFNKLSESIKNCEGSTSDMAATMLDNLQGSITLLQSALDGVKISFGGKLSPYVRGLADWLTEQMPEMENALDEMMEWFDGKVEEYKNKIREMTSSVQWSDADFFGKTKIAWDTLIAEPFAEWWDSTGRAMIAEKAADFGNAIGTGISTSLLMLLGIDVSNCEDEGVSVGRSFARGFAEGFDFNAVSSKFSDAIGNMFKSAGKLMPGGESPGLSSVISAMILAKLAKPVFSVGKGAASIGKGLFGTNAATGVSLASLLIGSTGNAMVSGSGLLGKLANVGYALNPGNTAGLYFGSTAGTMSGGAAALAGGGAIAGGVAGSAALISGFKDFKVALDKNTDAQKSRAYSASGAMKFGGAAAGAAAGAAIGTLIPVVGTAVGALAGFGIGGVGGMIAGNKEKEKYQEQMKAAEEAAQKMEKAYAATGRSAKDVRFESEILTAALEDGAVSAEKFASMYGAAVDEKIRSGFGDMRLTLKEVKDIAGSIVMSGEPVEQLNRFTSASGDAAESLGNFQSIYDSMSKLNWKAGLGYELETEDIDEYKEAAEKMIQSAKDYIEDKHFEATAALQLLLGDVDTSSITAGVDNLYKTLQYRINEIQNKMNLEMQIFLKDGVLTIDEEKEIQSLMEQLQKVTETVSNAETSAAFETLKIKYGGANMDAESFAKLQQQIQKEVEGLTGTYDEALKIGITNLNLELSEGFIDKHEFNDQLKALSDAYDAKIDELEVRVEKFQLETISEAFETELDGILPDIEGTTAEKLSQAIQNAVDAGVNPATWDAATAARFLGLEGLDTATQDAIIPFITSVAESMPGKIKEALSNSGIGEAMMIGISNGVTQLEGLDEMFGPLGDEVSSAAVTSIMESMKEADLSEFENVVDQYSTYLDDSFNGKLLEVGKTAGSGIAGNIGNAVGSHAADTHPGVDLVCSDLDGYVKGTIGQMNVAVSPTLTVNWIVKNNMPEIGTPSVSGGASVSVSAPKKASGGFVNGMQLSWVGEEGPEAIIPLVPGRRSRALELYRETGKMLGITAHANGGIVGGGLPQKQPYPPVGMSTAASGIMNAPAAYNEASGKDYYRSGKDADQSKPEVTVNVSVNPDFHITQEQGQNGEEVMKTILDNISELADKIGGDIAGKLLAIFGNMA